MQSQDEKKSKFSIENLQIFPKLYFFVVLIGEKLKKYESRNLLWFYQNLDFVQIISERSLKIIWHVNWTVATGSKKAIQLDCIITADVLALLEKIGIFGFLSILGLSFKHGSCWQFLWSCCFFKFRKTIWELIFDIFFSAHCSQHYLPLKHSHQQIICC